jgi:hypothetical protein
MNSIRLQDNFAISKKKKKNFKCVSPDKIFFKI